MAKKKGGTSMVETARSKSRSKAANAYRKGE
jgi:hypothetical protein